MRNKGFVIVLALVISLLCIYFISFTFVSRRVQQDATRYATDKQGNESLARRQHYLDSMWNKPVYSLFGMEYTFKEVKENELSLGLDLQGGMHVVLEVSPVEVVVGLSGNNQDPSFQDAIKEARQLHRNSTRSFPDIFAEVFKSKNPGKSLASVFASTTTRGRISLSDTDDAVLKVLNTEVESAIDRSFTILKTRIDQFGTSQPNIQRLPGTGRIQIEIPGADNPQRVRKLLQGVAHLEFWDVVEAFDPQLNSAVTALNNKIVQEQRAAKSVETPGSETKQTKVDSTLTGLEKELATAAADSTKNLLDSLSNKMSPLFSLMNPQVPFQYNLRDTSTINSILNRADIRTFIPRNIGWFWSVKPDRTNGVSSEFLQLNFVNLGRSGKPLLSGEVVTDARNQFDDKGRPAVTMTMNAKGTKEWAKVTAIAASKNPNRGRIAIVLDKFVYTAPTVQNEIPTGNSQITGTFTIDEAKDLANVLKAGSLPAPTRIVEEAIIGPSLGEVAQNQGLISMACGLIIVVLFMVAYYAKGGMVANVALLFNIFFILGILANFNAALTLPGMAGIVLTMGMAVDANVLIYERIREELRLGRRLREAINKGYERAFASIFDSNLTTFLTALFLFVLGQGPLKGFAIVLMIGIGTSFFSAVYISRVIIEWMVRKGDDAKMTFETSLAWGGMKDNKINFIQNRRKAYIFSATVILIGAILIVVQGLNLGVDFRGGRSYVVTFNQPVDATKLRNDLVAGFENKGTEVKNYGSSNVMKVTTAYLVEDDTEEADEKVKTSLITGLEKATGKKYLENEKKMDDEHFAISSSTKVGPTIADDIKGSAFEAGTLAILSIFGYILLRFRKWQYSTGAIVALIHDALFTFAMFAIVRVFGFSFEIDQVFVAALLTIIGYSINDTVIIFDRIREYIGFGASHERERIFNDAINDTLSRTLITSGTTLIVVVVLLFFGGEVLRGFSFAMVIGIVIGTYSSIFIASPIVLDFDKAPAQVKA